MSQIACEPITIPKGIDYNFYGTLWQDEAKTQPFDLTGWSAAFELIIGTDTVVFGPENVTLGGDNGEYTVLVPRADTAQLDSCKTRYRMFLTDPDDLVQFAIYGPAEIITI